MMNPLNMLQTLGIGFAAIALVVGVEEIRLHDVRVDLKTATDDLATCSGNLTTSRANERVCEAGITARNSEIEADAANGKAAGVTAAAEADKTLAGAKERKAAASSEASGPATMNKFTRGAVK